VVTCDRSTLSIQLAATLLRMSRRSSKFTRHWRLLQQADPRLAEVAQMRYFGGYSEQEIAETLGITERTVQRDWEKARLILAAELR